MKSLLKHLFTVTIALLPPLVASAQNPILSGFHADPSARVFNGKLYIYPTHDLPDMKHWDEVDWHVFSSEDMTKWEDHGVRFSLADLTWANKEAWAPDCIERNGKYYFYFPAGGQIGVAVADSPIGPFKDALGHPLVKAGEAGIRYMIDPNVFIDDDGQAYLFVGGARQLGVVKLKEDMITRDGPIQLIDMPKFYEGVWIHKRNGLYYASYPTRESQKTKANVLVYSMSKSPLGPWEYKGELIDNQSPNVHGSITEFKGQWYLFYHVATSPEKRERQTCVEPLFYNEDGTIKPLKMSPRPALADKLTPAAIPAPPPSPPQTSSITIKLTDAKAESVAITDHGAIADGKTLNTKIIQSLVDKLALAGGGTVVVPPGVFVSGALFFKPGVHLHLEKNAVLRCSTDMANFPEQRTRIEGHFEERFNPALINADHCDGFRITGDGTLDGAGLSIWDAFWSRRKAAADKTNFRNLSVPRARLALIENSSDVVINNVTFKDSQFWNLHLYRCRNVRITEARFVVPDDYKQAPSSDGIDVDSCQDVTIRGCYFSVTDDCIALKGSKGPLALADQDSPPVERIRISDCIFKRGHAALTLGSEATVVRDVVMQDCQVLGAMPALHLKLRSDTPQHYENIRISGLVLDSSGGSVVAAKPWTQYTDLQGNPPPKSVVRNITISNVSGRFGSLGEILGNPGQTEISDLTLENINLQLKTTAFRPTQITDLKLINVIVNGKPLHPRNND